MESNKQSVLYISYDGMLEPLGQSQVLRYLESLATEYNIILLSYEKPEDWANKEERKALREHTRKNNITWIPLSYHKHPSALATAFDISQGIMVGFWVVLRHRVKLVHARSYVPSVIALVLKKIFRLKYIFDMRGFWADERVDGGLWPVGGRRYRVAKWFERKFLLNADCVVSLTQSAIDEMHTFEYLQNHMPRFERITTCADLTLFKPANQKTDITSDSSSTFTLGYVGSVGVWYLFDEVLRCFQLIQKRMPSAHFHIINRGGHDYIHERMAALSVSSVNVTIEEVGHAGVAKAMQGMDAGIFFYKPIYSKKATAPTKLGEFLGCGVPCLGNTGVGDMASILESEKVGVALESFDEPSISKAIDRFLDLVRTPDIQTRCRDVALRKFSLDEGVQSYKKLYSELMGKSA